MKKKIMIADDDPSIVDVIKIILETEGYPVFTTAGSKTILDMKKIMPALLLLDYRMPEMDGREITEKLKADPDTKHIPIIMISASKDVEDKALKAGADAFMSKPFDLYDLIETVSKFVNSE